MTLPAKRRCRVSPSELQKYVNQVADDFMINPEYILGRIRKKPYPEARRCVAKALRELGYSLSVIGRAMNRDHTMILYMVDDEFRKRSKRKNRITAMEHYYRSKSRGTI